MVKPNTNAPSLKLPEIVEYRTYVIRLNRRTHSGSWFSTVSKDAIRVFESENYQTLAEALEAASRNMA